MGARLHFEPPKELLHMAVEVMLVKTDFTLFPALMPKTRFH
jgi:hypothetical protein